MRARWTVLLAVALAAVTSEVRASEKLVLYTSQPTDQMKAVLDLFKTVAPEIEVEMFRSGTTEVLNKLAAEFAAGSPRADVLLIADEIAMMQLARDNRLLPIRKLRSPVSRRPSTIPRCVGSGPR